MGHRTQHSENSRWAARIALYRKLKEYDAAGEDYHVMGHSHGGSVIYHALLHSVAKRKPLERLKSWCTVGTPFLDCRPNRFLFNRLGGVGLTIYASAIGAIALAVFLVINIMTTRYAHVFANYLIALPLLLYGFVCLLAVYACERAWGGTHPTARKNKVAERYADRWIGLWHRDDEAISALANVRLVSAPIIPSNFLVPLISFVPVLLTITAALFAGLYPKDPASFVADLFLLPLKFLDPKLWNDGSGLTSDRALLTIFSQLAVYVALVVAAYVALTLPIVALVKQLAVLVGSPLSKVINAIVWSSVRQQAWGDDRVNEDVGRINTHPPEFAQKFAPLRLSVSFSARGIGSSCRARRHRSLSPQIAGHPIC